MDPPQSLTLRGHAAPVVDVEFLPSSPSDPLHILGTADTDSVVFLWALTLRAAPPPAAAPSGASTKAAPSPTVVRLGLVRRYSFYTLRHSRAVHYARLRLAGTAAAATMVLVPNDGSAPRLIKFSAAPVYDEGGRQVVAAAVAEGTRGAGGGGVVHPPPAVGRSSVMQLPLTEPTDCDSDSSDETM